MRNLHTSTPVGLASTKQSAEKSINQRGSHSVSLNDKNGVQVDVSTHQSFSQLSRSSVMRKNVKDASLFMDEQQRLEAVGQGVSNLYRVPGTITKIPKGFY